MTPVITLNRPMRIKLEDLPQWFNRSHTATPMLVYMCRTVLLHNRYFDRSELIAITASSVPHKVAAVEWNLMRINDTLPLAGWKLVDMHKKIYLTRLDDIQFGKVVERHRRRYG